MSCLYREVRSIASRNDRAESAASFTGSYRSMRSSVPSFRPIAGSLLASAIPRCSAKKSSVLTRILSSLNKAIGRLAWRRTALRPNSSSFRELTLPYLLISYYSILFSFFSAYFLLLR